MIRLTAVVAAVLLTASACGLRGGDDVEVDVEQARTTAGAVDSSTCLTYDDLEYCHLAFTPAGVEGTVPLVIDLHGLNGSNLRQRDGSGFQELAITEGFTVVWPGGQGASWNAGGCCGAAAGDDLDDVGYIRTLVDVVEMNHPIDRDRIYVTGLSNGCAMAQRLAADASDLVAAVGCMALYLLDEPAPDYGPVPVLEIHGTDDRLVAYEPAVFDGAVANMADWAERNGCDAEPVRTEGDGYTTDAWASCEADVALITVIDGGHSLYAGMETEVDTARLAWEFVSRYSATDRTN
ncbi:MAG: PHB depolymerase family esterase [Actinomycetota bacterium]